MNAPQERARLPDRSLIDGIDSVDALSTLLDEVIDAKMQIEVDLEHRSDASMDWERRARAALLAHRICEKNVRRRLGQLTRKGKLPADDEAAKELTRSNNRLAQAQDGLAAAQRKHTVAVEGRRMALLAVQKAIERGSYLVHFHKAAHALLDEPTCRQMDTDAQTRLRAAVEALAAEAAGPEPEE